MKRITSICVLVTGMYSSAALAAPPWEAKSYSGGQNVCHKEVLFESKWWAGSYHEPNPHGPTSSNQQGWGGDPWLPLLNSDECSSGSVNNAPVAHAGVDQEVQSPHKVILDGSGSSDIDNDILSFTWIQTSGPTVAIEKSDASRASFDLLERDRDTKYEFKLTVHDGKESSTDTIVINGLAAEQTNSAPVAEAGLDQVVQSPNRVVLDGSSSADVDNDNLTYKWEQLSGLDVMLENPTSPKATFSLDTLADDTEFTFQLTVSDGDASSLDTVKVTGLAVEQKQPGALTVDINGGDSGLPLSATYKLVLTSLQSGERNQYHFSLSEDVLVDDLTPGDYQVWVEFDQAYQAIALPTVITVTDTQPFELSFSVKPSVDLSNLSIIDGVEISKVTDGIFQARQMTWGDGYLFVGSSAISNEQGVRGNKIYAIPYDYQTGDVGEPIVVANNLIEPHGVAYHKGSLYFSTSASIYRIENVVSKLGQSLEPEKVFTLPAGDENFPLETTGLFWHQKHTLKFNPNDGNDDHLYVSVGSPCNICVIDEEPRYGSILKIDTDNFNATQIADGIRNTVGFDWDPKTGDLWFTDNNPQNTSGHTTYFPGEINKISAVQLANGEMPHFGFPYVSGIDTISITPEQDNGTAINTGGYDYLPPEAIYSDVPLSEIDPLDYQAPEFELEAGTAPLGLTFWQPDGVQLESGEHSFVYATHGPGDGERAGYEVRLLTLDATGKPLFDRALVTGWKQPSGITGKPVEFLVMPDNSLLLSDDAGNTVYRLKYEPEESGQVTLSPSQGELESPQTMVQATLTDSSGNSRRLYMSLTKSDYVISGLDYGDYTLTIPAHNGVDATQTITQFSLSESDSIEGVNWSYGGGDTSLSTATLSVNAPVKPSDAAGSILLALMESNAGGNPEYVFVDSNWGEITTSEVAVGSYQVDFPFTESAIPTPQSAKVNLSDKGASLTWTYTEYENDEDYFNAMLESSCGSCHTGHFAPDFSNGPSNAMLGAYGTNPNAISEKLAEMVDTYGLSCDWACQETLGRYLEDELWADELPEPNNTEVFGSRHLRLLSRVEYVNTVSDLFNVEVDPERLPLEDKDTEGSLYGNSGKTGYLTSDKMNAYLNAAVYVEENVDIYAVSQCKQGVGSTPNWDPNVTYLGEAGGKLDEFVVHESNVYQAMYWTKGNPPSEHYGNGKPWKLLEKYVEGDSNCLTNWYMNTLERMLRRPVTQEDLLLYPAQEIEKQLTELLISPHFIYRREAGTLNEEGRYTLSAHELATLISYTLVGSIPDTELWGKAKDGTLLQRTVLEEQIDRLLASPEAYEQFATFMMQTLEFDEARVVVEREGMSKEIGQAMVDEFKQYIKETVFNENLGRFSDLFSHDKTYVNQKLADHYGFGENVGSDLSEVSIPAMRGKGLLSLGAIAVAYSTEGQTRLIPRGKMVQHSLLGWEQSLPSGKAPQGIEDDVSTKDFWTKATGPSTDCWVCHQKMNDIGFAYDVLDKTGRYRAYEDYMALNGETFESVLLETSGVLVDVDHTDSSFEDLNDIALYIANSEQARKTFVKNYLSYTLGEASSRFSPLYPEYASFEQFKSLMSDLLTSKVVLEREE